MIVGVGVKKGVDGVGDTVLVGVILLLGDGVLVGMDVGGVGEEGGDTMGVPLGVLKGVGDGEAEGGVPLVLVGMGLELGVAIALGVLPPGGELVGVGLVADDVGGTLVLVGV
jgi:hypothetical protein